MSSEEASVRPEASDPNQLREDLFVPLATISARIEMLRRIAMVTPGLTNLERTFFSKGSLPLKKLRSNSGSSWRQWLPGKL